MLVPVFALKNSTANIFVHIIFQLGDDFFGAYPGSGTPGFLDINNFAALIKHCSLTS